MNKYSGWEMVVFHNWSWESYLVYLTVLLFPELNKEHLEPVSICLSIWGAIKHVCSRLLPT